MIRSIIFCILFSILIVGCGTMTSMTVMNVDRPVLVGPVEKIGGGKVHDSNAEKHYIHIESMGYYDVTNTDTMSYRQTANSRADVFDNTLNSYINGQTDVIVLDEIFFSSSVVSFGPGGNTQKARIVAKGNVYSGRSR